MDVSPLCLYWEILVNGDVDGLISLEVEGGILEGWGAHLTPSVVTEAVLL